MRDGARKVHKKAVFIDYKRTSPFLVKCRENAPKRTCAVTICYNGNGERVRHPGRVGFAVEIEQGLPVRVGFIGQRAPFGGVALAEGGGVFSEGIQRRLA